MAQQKLQLKIGGMACSFCAQSINKAVGGLDGVEDVSVSIAHEEVLIQYDDAVASRLEMEDTLRELGYTIRDPNKKKRYDEQQAELGQAWRHLLISGAATLLSAAVMLYMMFGIGTFESQSALMDGAVLALAVGTMFGPAWYVKKKAYYSLKRGILNQHVLLEAGAFAGLAGGLLGMFVVPSFPTVHFFAVSVFVTTYHILSEYTSLKVRTRASRAVQELLDLQPDTARRLDEDGEEEVVEVDELEVGDRVRIRPGENVPIDGRVVDGESVIDESVATGESDPIDKQAGDEVIGGSVNTTGALVVEVTATGEETFLNQVARQIEEARAMKPGIIQLAERVLAYFVPGVLAISVASFVFWVVAPPLWGAAPAVQRGAFAALAVLVLGYPCALGMATPLALIRGGGRAAKRGILMRSGEAFQVIKDIDTIALDKTGTITQGKPSVLEVVPLGNRTEADVLRPAASAEHPSEHPLAEAIRRQAENQDVRIEAPDSFESVTGKGVRAVVDGRPVLVGKPSWLTSEDIELGATSEIIERMQDKALTTVGVAVAGELIGLVGIGDDLKSDAREIIDWMKRSGITPIIITGDNERTGQAVADEIGIDRVLAEILPDEKRREIARLQEEGRTVMMVGDGINDAPALMQANVGMAIGAGTDIAIESADVVLMGDRLGGIADTYDIGRQSYRKTQQNLVMAFSFNGIGVAAATTGLVHPIWAMIAMVASVSAVLANSFGGRLLSTEREQMSGPEEPPSEEPTRLVFTVSNMKCEHCVETIRQALHERDDDLEVEVDLDEHRLEIVLPNGSLTPEGIRKTLIEAGFKAEADSERTDVQFS